MTIQNMVLRTFAEAHRLKLQYDECGEHIIRGRCGQIYEHGSSRLAVMILAATARQWNIIRRSCLTVGMELHQNGDLEGTLTFDPEDKTQARLAIKVVGARHKRRLSEEQRASLVARLRRPEELPLAA